MSQGRRLGFLDIKFCDEPELFTDNQETIFGIPITKIKVSILASLSSKLGILLDAEVICPMMSTPLNN